jgi:hypothetical protein
MKLLVALTGWRAESPLDGADTAIWLAAGPDVEGVRKRFWNKRRERPCKFRHSADIEPLWILVEQQLGQVTAPIAS